MICKYKKRHLHSWRSYRRWYFGNPAYCEIYMGEDGELYAILRNPDGCTHADFNK